MFKLNRKKVLWITMMLVFTLFVVMPCSASAASTKWKNACKAYAAYLAKYESNYKMNYDVTSTNPESKNTVYNFMLVDLDKDGVPELIGVHYNNAKSTVISVFTYKNGKIVKLKSLNGISTAQGYYTSFVCKQRHFHLNYYGGFTGYDYCGYQMKSGKISVYAQKQYEALPNKTTIKVNGKTASANTYNNAVRNCVTDKKYVYYRNTASNRKKYLYSTGKVTNLVSAVKPSVSISKSIVSGKSTGKLIAKTVPGNAVVKWVSSNSSIVSVDQNGNLRAKGKGSATITASMTYGGAQYSNSITVSTSAASKYGGWSKWTLKEIPKATGRQVEIKPFYRYYCFECPVCGGREPFQGTSDCGRYTLGTGNKKVLWSMTPYTKANPRKYSYTSKKYYTESLGDGKRWSFSAGNLNAVKTGTLDADGSGTAVIVNGYRSRTMSNYYYFK